MQQNVQLRRELLADVEAVAPTLAEHAADSERLARLNARSVEALRRTRLLRFISPKERGGDEADPVTHLEIIEALAKIDGSAAWNVGILAGTSMIVAAFLPPASSKKVFASGVPPMAGMLSPRGRARPVDGGYRVDGTWSFGSGIHHADWVLASAVVPEEPLPAAVRVVVLPQNQVVIHDNWQVAGLKASGSCDYSIDDVFVPEAMTFRFTDLLSGAAVVGGTALKIGMPALVMPFHFGIALGVARRALDEVTAQAIEKSRGPIRPSLLVAQAPFQFSLGKAELELAAARALAIAILSAAWEQAATGSVPPPAMQAEVRAAASYVTEVAQRVTTVAFQSVGGGALFDTNPLQRCFRDIYAAGQHFTMSRSAFQAFGQFKLHRPDANPML